MEEQIKFTDGELNKIYYISVKELKRISHLAHPCPVCFANLESIIGKIKKELENLKIDDKGGKKNE